MCVQQVSLCIHPSLPSYTLQSLLHVYETPLHDHLDRKIFNSLHVLLVLVTPRSANCDSLMKLDQSSTSAIFSRFPEACSQRRNSCALKYFGVLHLVLSRRKLSCEQFSSPIALTTFYNAFFQRRDWYVMMA